MPVMTTPRFALILSVDTQATETRNPQAHTLSQDEPQLAVQGRDGGATLVHQQPGLLRLNEAIRGPPPLCQLCEPGRSYPSGFWYGRRSCWLIRLSVDRRPGVAPSR